MAEKGDFEKAERKLAELGIDFTAAEQKNALSGAPETEWARVDGRNSESVISVTFRKVHDAIEAAAQQIKQVGTGFVFRSPVAVGGRGGAARGSTLKKLEDVENAYNCIVIDPALKRLTIQLDAAELETQQVKAYVVQKDGTMRNVSLESDGDLLTGLPTNANCISKPNCAQTPIAGINIPTNTTVRTDKMRNRGLDGAI